MAETTTVTVDTWMAARTRLAEWSMRSAPKSELPPNLKATTLRECLPAPPTQCTRRCNAAELGSAADSSSLAAARFRSEEHTSELQSHLNLVCRLLLEK